MNRWRPPYAWLLIVVSLIASGCGSTEQDRLFALAVTPCEKAWVAHARADLSSADYGSTLRTMAMTCTASDAEAANEKLSTAATRSPNGWIDQRCREGQGQLADTLMCRTRQD